MKNRIKESTTPNRGFLHLKTIETPLGQMVAAATDAGICMLEFGDCKMINLEMRQLEAFFGVPLVRGESSYFDTLSYQLDEYFSGVCREFDIPLDIVGTPFQKEVWLSLLQVPYGATTTYAAQAASIGRAKSVRAVANANGKNKIAIILPCHRVIGTNGNLTGYAGGIWRKEKLLELERNNIAG